MNAYVDVLWFVVGTANGTYWTALWYQTKVEHWRERAHRPLVMPNPSPEAIDERVRAELRSVAKKWGCSQEEACDRLGLDIERIKE